MNKLIKYLKLMIIPLSVIFIMPLLLSILNLLNINTSKTLILIIMIITMLISGILLGKKIEKKGYLKGLLLGISLSLFMLIFSLLFKNNYNISTLLYYSIIIVSSVIGSMIGVNKQKK